MTERTDHLPRDADHIDTSQESECRWWCEKLGVSPEALQAAVREVGTSASDVERRLRDQAQVPRSA
jgi:hypothetical protein